MIRKRKAFIYGLRALNSKKYRYIGTTIQDPEKRIAKHLEKAMNNSHENKALQQFLLDSKFQIDILAECDTEKQFIVEKNLIRLFIKLKHPLLNIIK